MDARNRVSPDRLENLEFCADLTDGDRAILASLLTPIELGFDQVLFRSGETADACYLVERGLVALEVCAPGVGCRRMITVGPGELIGWSPFIRGACFTATARTVEDSCVLKMSSESILQACDRNPAFGYHILQQVVRVLAARINSSRMQLLDLFGPENPIVPHYPDMSSTLEGNSDDAAN